ncbi:MAG: PilN domain-containing protein [Planctomycetes bacterium]|nr:PilN domain-containing protein [Planctomycetota bacterium]MBL7144078.1 PilN domain-containing protein [Phycisphaerae bacterium]
MANINFVPDDYVQNTESSRTNLLYFVLFGVVMIALCGSFMTIKIRQRACGVKEQLVNTKMTKIQEAIKKFEELQTKRGEMMRTALTTSQLIEPVPRSVLLASLTNNLPQGVSLLKLGLLQKESGRSLQSAPTSKYQSKQGQKDAANAQQISQESLLDTHIDIEGVAPSDLQVAEYIGRLGNSSLLDNVALVESKEHEVKDSNTFRRFKLTAMLKKEVHLTREDVKNIRDEAENAMWNF